MNQSKYRKSFNGKNNNDAKEIVEEKKISPLLSAKIKMIIWAGLDILSISTSFGDKFPETIADVILAIVFTKLAISNYKKYKSLKAEESSKEFVRKRS